MRTYETIFITPPNLTEDEEAVAVSALLSVVTDGGGLVTANERMGRRRLAYPIQNFNDGVYTRFLYDSVPDVPLEIERRVRITDKVLRSLTVRLDGDWAEASKVQAVKDAEERVLAAEREREEAERAAAEAAEAAAVAAAAPPAVEGEGEATSAAAGEAGATAAEPATEKPAEAGPERTDDADRQES